jgi:hypothetical protein
MCHYYESTEEWQALWVKRAECREAEQAEEAPEADFEDPASPTVDV